MPAMDGNATVLPPGPGDELEHAHQLCEMIDRVRERVLRERAEQEAARAQCVDLGAEREARAPAHRDDEIITCTRGDLRRTVNAVFAEALEREIASRFRPRLVGVPGGDS